MEERRNKDGRTRRKETERLKVKQPFYALEEDFSNLFARAMHLGRAIRYYSASDGPDGDFASLYRYQPLVVLNEILQYDTSLPEQEFVRLNNTPVKECEQGQKALKDALSELLGDWHDRLNTSFIEKDDSLLRTEINNDYRLLTHQQQQQDHSNRRIFYFLIRSIRRLQQKQAVLLDDLLESGTVDPSLAVLVAMIRNYRWIVRRFNDRWKEYSRFYLEHILHAETEEPVWPHAWFVIRRNRETEYSVLPENTVFLAATTSDLPTFRYRTEETYYLNNMQLRKVYSLLLEKDREKYPAARVGYVTSVLQKDLSDCIERAAEGTTEKTPHILFGHPDNGQEELDQSQLVTAGLMVESAMLLLREGNRQVEIGFGLTSESAEDFERLADRIGTTDEKAGREKKNRKDFWIYKILDDIFELEISTEKGWQPILHYTLSYEQERQIFLLKFSLNENFPPTLPCSELHGHTTRYPALRIWINREAWLFPYSWMIQTYIEKLTITTTVKGITSLEIHNELGQVDPSNPFPPFGTQPGQGAWLAFGNYEIASKSVTSLTVHFHWQQLPSDECGFYDHYRGYPGDIDNASFRIRLERLTDKRWTSVPASDAFLFATSSDGKVLSPRGSLADHSRVDWRLKEDKEEERPLEEKYRYGLTRNGFYRIVLDEPEIGFGHVAYRQVFADVMMFNSSHRKKKTPPAMPVIPILDRMEAGYIATEEYLFAGGKKEERLGLYYLSPLQEQQMSRPEPGRPIPFIKAPHNEGNLFFAIRNAVGNTQIRLLMDMVSLKREVETEELPHIQWYYLDHSTWVPIRPEAVCTDTTESFLRSGLIELNLSRPVTHKQLDKNGDFWLSAVLTERTQNCSALAGIYLNPVRAILEADADTELTPELQQKAEAFCGKFDFEKTQPALTEVYRVLNDRNGRPAESFDARKVRIVQRISHRNRAVVPADYEQMILAEFPEVEKIYCLPGIDTKGKNRKAIVTLVVMQRENNKKIWPLCEPKLLLEIEQYMQPYVSPFVTVDAITPGYEKVTVRGWFSVEPGKHTGLIIREAEERINRCIAPWDTEKEWPVFGHSFSSTDLYNTIREDAAIRDLIHLSVLHVVQSKEESEQRYRVHRHYEERQTEFVIAPSAPWCILVPEEKHLLSVGIPEEGRHKPGIGDLRIGGTFIVNE